MSDLYQSLDKRIWFTVLFFILKWVACCSKYCCCFPQFFVKLWPILSQSELSLTELPKCIPSIFMEDYHLSCFINSFLYDLANKSWFFEVYLEIWTSYSFKITFILVLQLIPLKKNGGVIDKICCLISWSSICTPLVLVQLQWRWQVPQPQ